MAKDAIVLGYPYWNAFYWLSSAESWRNLKLKGAYEGSHSYYQNLYHVDDIAMIDEVASITLLYDRIILSPADCPLPDQEKFYSNNSYINPELGIHSSGLSDDKRQAKEDFVDRMTIPDHLFLYFDSNQRHHLNHILMDMVSQVVLAFENECPLVVGKKYLEVYKFIGLSLQKGIAENISAGSKVAGGIKTIQKVTGFQFELQSFEEFKELRNDKNIKDYANNLQKNLTNPSRIEVSDEAALLKSMLEAMNTEKINSKISKGLDVSSSILGLAGMIPILGTATGIAGIAADGANKLLARKIEANNWWSIFPKISEKLTVHRVEKRLKEIENRL